MPPVFTFVIRKLYTYENQFCILNRGDGVLGFIFIFTIEKKNTIYENIQPKSPNHNKFLSNSINNIDSNFIAKFIVDRFNLIFELDN